MKFKINEIFQSLQGEGIWVGKPMNFIRFTCCNLNCFWCDTDFEEGERLCLEEIIKKLNSRLYWISLTGGEPLLEENLSGLITALQNNGFYLFLETNGTINQPNIFQSVDFLSVDLKPPSSQNCQYHQETLKYCLQNPRQTQLKVIIQTKEDWDFFQGIYEEFEGKRYPHWVLQPENSTLPNLPYFWSEILTEIPNNVRVIPQIHKFLDLK